MQILLLFRSVAFAGSSVSAHKDTQRFPVAVHRPRTVHIAIGGKVISMRPRILN